MYVVCNVKFAQKYAYQIPPHLIFCTPGKTKIKLHNQDTKHQQHSWQALNKIKQWIMMRNQHNQKFQESRRMKQNSYNLS